MRTIIVTGVALLLGSCSHLELGRSLRTSPADWPTDARDSSRTNRTMETVQPPLTLRWSGDVTGGIGSGSPLVIDSMLVIGTLRGELYVFDIRNGKREGWLSFGDAIQGSPVVRGDIVYVAVSNTPESLTAYNLKTGKRIWSKAYGDIEGSPAYAAGRLYVGNLAGEVFCVDPERGEEVWNYQVPENRLMKGFRAPPAYGHGTILFGCDDGILYALNAETGKMTWKAHTGHPIVASPLVADGRAYVGNLGGVFTCIDLVNGNEIWKRDVGSSVFGGAALGDGTVLCVTSGGLMYALERETGDIVWRTDLGSVVNAAPVVAGTIAYVGTLRKSLYAVDVKGGEIVYQYMLEGRVKTPPAVAFGQLFVATDDRLIMAFSGKGAE